MHWLGLIAGGEPGTDTESITLTNCELKHEPGCEINGQKAGKATISFSSTETELVYLNKTHTEVGDLYTPALQPFASITLGGTGCGLKATFELTGSAVAKVTSGVHKYQLVQTQEFLPSGTSYEYWTGTAWSTGTSKLEFGGSPSRFTGVTDMELFSGQEFMVE
jgi:hypothetical protein